MNLHKPLLFTSFLFNTLQFCFSIDSITLNRTVKDGEVLVSSGQVFELGFFSPSNDTTNRYVGIWYHKVSEKRVVWVANRDAPVSDDSGVLTLTNHGLVLYEKNQTAPIWSTNVSNSASVAKLLDLGNLVLLGERTQEILWQSFDYPSDTLLPFMKLGLNKRTGLNQFLSSWKSNSDPGIGNVTYKIDRTGYPQLFLFRGLDPWWRGGPWTGLRWSGVPQMTKSYIFNVSFVNNESEVSIEYGVTNASLVSIMYLDASSGMVKRSTWNEQDHQWFEFWSAPNEPCDSYGVCGPNGNCDPYDSDNFMCKCLPGFVPKSQRDWFLRDGKQGCVRKPGLSTCRSGEGFVKLVRVKLPDTSTAWVDNGLTLKQCGEDCLKNCSCTAYTSADERGLGCLRWFGDLNDTRTYSKLGQDLYLRVEANELAKYAKAKGPLANQGIQAIVIVSIVLTICIIVGVVYYLIRRRKRRSSSLRDKNLPFSFRSSSYLADSPSTQGRNTELPIFDLSVIASATNNFSEDNKLGEGGFGSVYKGKLHNGQEIAVKRLAKYSGQGTQEFKNEVTLISKLQHRNLVKMLGCCVQGHEKMLIYEFLPNKSLDFFIFDETKRSLLDWPTRYKILCGVARGILYLHEDSRLKIIHRDLKASNVLLDASMNPKISDFGMARIFGVDQMEANTNRVVGTYGYMSPEYAMQGLFSIKSDVYSFGVLLLEIVSGKKNSKYYEEKTSSNLVGHVWNLWKEGRALEIVDTTMGDSYSEQEVWRCIQIGLLCVQESANDRPNMSAVVFMLSNNDTVLQSPNQPAFILKTRNYTSGDPSTSGGASSVNDVTVSMLEAR